MSGRWLLVVLLAAGCGSKKEPHQSSIAVEDNVRAWANTASAVAVYTYAHGPISFADGEEPFADPACPATEDDGTTVTITGGCTDSGNDEWGGTATVERETDGSQTLTLDDYGHWDAGEDGARTTGSVTLTEIDALTHEFDVNLVSDGGMTVTIRYEGRIEGGYDTATVWNGSGTVERDGFLPPTGVVDATTVDERLDDAVCSGQPVSGTTTIADDNHEVVVTYDGETDCDDSQAAAWSVDGEDQGLLTGIACSATGASVPGGPWALGLALVLPIAWRRRPRA